MVIMVMVMVTMVTMVMVMIVMGFLTVCIVFLKDKTLHMML